MYGIVRTLHMPTVRHDLRRPYTTGYIHYTCGESPVKAHAAASPKAPSPSLAAVHTCAATSATHTTLKASKPLFKKCHHYFPRTAAPIMIMFRVEGKALQGQTVEEFMSTIVPSHADAIIAVQIVIQDVKTLSALGLITLQAFPLLRIITLSLRCDLGDDSDAHVNSVRELQRIVFSLPENARLESLVLEGLFSSTILSRRWARSPVVKALRAPLHTLACHLVALNDRGARTPLVTVRPARGTSHTRANYNQWEQKRIESLLSELDQQAMLRY
ncbi:hypothetical protein PHLGIDRAFT_37152 [Phlebiopsis gigantea 11061_1 CR5-6]|uniref:Uncharacterized protein n=1 Tax=Phlebiopsis gigantea (strain 11061_1 CR5-6) TaxID=745531 RepID=A0A0C3NGV5_PHLG1|nr:hypothetical protein PHLGIDRAFT_37152 [Phlebiopsis gigantea 11061_1 CR5-6]